MEGKRPSRTTETTQNSKEQLGSSGSVEGCDNDNVLQVIYTNADSLTNKRDDLLLFLNSLDFKPSIIIITEVNSKVFCKMLESEFYIVDYNIYSTNVGTTMGRGIIVYVHVSLVACQLHISTSFQEGLLVKIKQKEKHILTVGAFYRSPSSSLINDAYLFELLDSLMKSTVGEVLIVGD